MTLTNVLRSMSVQARAAVAAMLAMVLGLSLMASVGAGTASAANRDFLRADATGTCDWDPVAYWVQRCDVWSPATGRNIPVQIQPAKNGGNAGLYMLDGLRATNDFNAWTHDSNAPAQYVDSNITLVMPIGGAASFYANWDGPATYDINDPVTYQWETFLTEELPAYLQQNFGVAPNNNSVLGLSMGGTAALNLAAKHPQQFRQSISISGFPWTTMPGMQTMMRVALLDAGGFNINSMYGSMLSGRRFENDPYLNMGGLKGSDVYISAGTGLPGQVDFGYPVDQQISGSLLEMLSSATTRMWEAKARVQGLNVTADYPVTGLHNWSMFDMEMKRTHDRVLNVMNAW